MALSASVTSIPITGDVIAQSMELFEQFKQQFNRQYSALENASRFETFRLNLKRVVDLQLEHPSARFGVNEFMDLTNEEFEARFGLNTFDAEAIPEEFMDNEESLDLSDDSLPASVNYEHCYSRVRDQGSCGSCWAFATAAVIEGAYCKAGKPIGDFLSVQRLLDCDHHQLGCLGATSLVEPLKFAKFKGMCLEHEYPYFRDEQEAEKEKEDHDQDTPRLGEEGIGKNKRCKAGEKCTKFFKIDGVTNLNRWLKPKINGLELAAAVAKYGPATVSVGVNDVFRFYTSGVLSVGDCHPEQRNHAVTVVAYETLEDGDLAFKIRNSWGPHWGENGNIRLRFGACLLGKDFAAVARVKPARMEEEAEERM